MNTLNRTIQPKEHVVIRKELMLPGFQSLEHRVFVAEGGFGMSPFTSGTCIAGHFALDGEHARIEGTEIDPAETASYQDAQARCLECNQPITQEQLDKYGICDDCIAKINAPEFPIYYDAQVREHQEF